MAEDDIIISKVVETRLQRKDLRSERQRLREEKQMIEPTSKQLIELAKMFHPYYARDLIGIQARIDEITELLQEE